ncbi:hypothetical protein P3S67_003659 [Capsicum chacoense]
MGEILGEEKKLHALMEEKKRGRVDMVDITFVDMSKDTGYYCLRLVIYLVVSFCAGNTYFNVGTKYSSIQARGACAAFIFGFMTFMSIGGFPSFVEDMKVGASYDSFSKGQDEWALWCGCIFHKQHVLCNAIPCIDCTTFRHCLLLHGSLPSRPCLSGPMMAIASVVPNFLMGIVIGAGILGISMVVSGFFRLPHDIPKRFWRYPVSYMTFHFWAVQGQYKNDLKELIFDNQSLDLPKITGEYALKETFQIDVNRSKWVDLSVIF